MRQELGSRGHELRHAARSDGRLAEVYPYPALIEALPKSFADQLDAAICATVAVKIVKGRPTA